MLGRRITLGSKWSTTGPGVLGPVATRSAPTSWSRHCGWTLRCACQRDSSILALLRYVRAVKASDAAPTHTPAITKPSFTTPGMPQRRRGPGAGPTQGEVPTEGNAVGPCGAAPPFDVHHDDDGAIRILVEAKGAGVKTLSDKHIEQAENYASRQGLPWVLLTNGVAWQLYHLTFNEGEGIAHELAFEANLVEELAQDAESLWARLGLLTRASVKKGVLEDNWDQKKVLSPASVVRVLFHEDVLREVRRLLRKDADAMLDIQDVFKAVRDVISNEALANAGEARHREAQEAAPEGAAHRRYDRPDCDGRGRRGRHLPRRAGRPGSAGRYGG